MLTTLQKLTINYSLVIVFISSSALQAHAGIFNWLKNLANTESNASSLTMLADYEIDIVDGQTISVCTGNFYDSGGSAGKYSANEDYTVTFCSDNGNAINFNFTQFKTESSSQFKSFRIMLTSP